jgi:hypothetical protein
MADAPSTAQISASPRGREVLIGIPFLQGGIWVTRYFTSEAEAAAATRHLHRTVEDLLREPCEQSDEEFFEMLDALDEIRHRNPPTPLPEPLP